MEIKQIASLLNTVAKETLGESAIVAEDLSNIVDIGQQYENTIGYDHFVKSLVNHIGKVVFTDRVYKGRAPSLYMDEWEYGSIMERIHVEMPEAVENEAWELEDGASYDEHIFHKPTVTVGYWNKASVFEFDISIPDYQVKESFSSPAQMVGFVSSLRLAVDNKITMIMDDLIMRTLNNLIAETVHDDFGSTTISTTSGIKAVNLLYLYNNSGIPESSITAAEALTDASFLRFASKIMKDYIYRLSVMSTLFNIGGKERFTDTDNLHTVLLSEFETAAGSYLYNANGQFLVNNIELPKADVVPYWQASGTDYAFGTTGKIDVKTASGNDVTITGVLGVMFDRYAAGTLAERHTVKVSESKKGDFWNEFHKLFTRYFNDTNENCVVFFVA